MACDGLLFCTPTGSTAYNLALGGSSLEPDTGIVIMRLIHPHLTKFHSLSFKNSRKFEVQFRGINEARVLVDGVYDFWVKPSEKVIIKKSRTKTHFLKKPEDDYLIKLRIAVI